MAALALGQRLSQGVPTRAPLLRQPSPLGRPALAFRPSAPQAWLARRGERLAAAALQEVAPPPWEYGDGGIFADPEAEPGEYGYGSSPRGPPSPSSSSSSTATGLRPLPRDVEGVADDASLGNPLQRMERLGTAWFGTIFELDGVCIGEQRSRGAIHEGCGGVGAARRKQRQQLGTEPCLAQLSCATGAYCRSPASEQPLPSVGPPLLPPLTTLAEYECGDGGRSWQALAAEEGKSPPPLWALKKARGMKNEQVWVCACAYGAVGALQGCCGSLTGERAGRRGGSSRTASPEAASWFCCRCRCSPAAPIPARASPASLLSPLPAPGGDRGFQLDAQPCGGAAAGAAARGHSGGAAGAGASPWCHQEWSNSWTSCRCVGAAPASLSALERGLCCSGLTVPPLEGLAAAEPGGRGGRCGGGGGGGGGGLC